jgi:alanyl-tRNA synthetase
VRRTGEIGALLLRKVEKVKQITRVEFLAGARAIAAARGDFERLSAIAAQASTAIEEVPALFDRLRADLKQAEGSRRALETEVNTFRATALYQASRPDSSGLRTIIAKGETVDGLRGLGQALANQAGVLFVGTLDAPPTVVVATSADSERDANALLKARLAAAGGRGGGNARLAQGTVPTTEVLDILVREITTR